VLFASGGRRDRLVEMAKNAPSIRKLLKIVAKSEPARRMAAGSVFARSQVSMAGGARAWAGSVATRPGGGARSGRSFEVRGSRWPHSPDPPRPPCLDLGRRRRGAGEGGGERVTVLDRVDGASILVDKGREASTQVLW